MLTCAFVCVYLNTVGPGVWTFAAETCSDTGLALVVLTMYVWEIFTSFSTEALVAEKPTMTFVLYGALSCCAVVFIWFFMGETKGLSEKEKKEIFMPGAVYGRNLREGELPLPELGYEHKSRRTLHSELLRVSTDIQSDT